MQNPEPHMEPEEPKAAVAVVVDEEQHPQETLLTQTAATAEEIKGNQEF